MNTPHVYDNAAAAAAGCAEFILSALADAVLQRGAATLAVSGGRTPALLFAILSEADFPWDKLHIFFVDERCVPLDDPQSNYLLLKTHLHANTNVHIVPVGAPPEQAAAQYADILRAHFHLAPGEFPRFDVIQHGMGPDGHTASLFPGEPLIADRSGLVAAVTSETKPPRDRITLLPGVLLASRATVFLLDGVDKQAALREVLLGAPDASLYPSQLLARSEKQVDWFLAGLTWPAATAL